jgi:hypothetical protein
MQHLDEGTVHAWLDGELSETESAAAAQHVAACAQCAALVADARGMIAGAARIVASLDAGPIGVIPKSTRGQAGKANGSWRRFVRSPSRMAMAATILVAVGVTLTMSRAVREKTLPSPAADEAPAISNPPAASGSPAAESKDRAVRTAPKAPSPVTLKQPGGNQAGAISSPNKQAVTAVASAVADNRFADKKKDADARRDRPDVAKTFRDDRPQTQAAPSAMPARPDSVALRQELAKVLVDSSAAKPAAAPAVRQLQAVTGVSQLREAGAQPQSSRMAALDVVDKASLQGCYRLSVDTSGWRDVLPASFVLTGPSSRVQGVAGGRAVSPQTASASANSVERFAQKAEAASYVVRAVGMNGQADSAAIGDWTAVTPMTARIHFGTVDQARRASAVTVFISTGSPVARVSAGDRTDSLRVSRIACLR